MKKRQNTNGSNEQAVVSRQEEMSPTPGDEPIDEKAEINKLLNEGYSVKQLIALGFKRRTAYHYAKLRMQPENDPSGSGQSVTAAGQAEIVKNQLDIMREAKESSKDIAQEAAQQAALRVASFIEQKIPRAESSGEPSIAERMLGPMADMAGKQMANMFAKMFGMPVQGQPGEQPLVPPGWEYRTEGGE